jgi:hypothetical protein
MPVSAGVVSDAGRIDAEFGDVLRGVGQYVPIPRDPPYVQKLSPFTYGDQVVSGHVAMCRLDGAMGRDRRWPGYNPWVFGEAINSWQLMIDQFVVNVNTQPTRGGSSSIPPARSNSPKYVPISIAIREPSAPIVMDVGAELRLGRRIGALHQASGRQEQKTGCNAEHDSEHGNDDRAKGHQKLFIVHNPGSEPRSHWRFVGGIMWLLTGLAAGFLLLCASYRSRAFYWAGFLTPLMWFGSVVGLIIGAQMRSPSPCRR